MINSIYQLVSPHVFSVKYQQMDTNDKVIIRPEYMAICHADQRYYRGLRNPKDLAKKLPMALIHECAGIVIKDNSGSFKAGQRVVMVPNIPGDSLDGIYENYAPNSGFLSSGHDGFMRELVSINSDRVVSYENIDSTTAAITEFISVAVHAVSRLEKKAHSYRNDFVIFGDGSLSYVVSLVLKNVFPSAKITVVGMNPKKLDLFSFVDNTYLVNELPEDYRCDHAFECCGGEGSQSAISEIIAHIRPQGTIMLMGVSENPVPIFTRMVLEKGLTIIGSSRSGRKDFERAISLMQNVEMQTRLTSIIQEDEPVHYVKDIHRAFETDLTTPFKTVFKWNI
ncbi:MAG: ribitol-5-phosphate dehydrogenase [Clostridiales bacterium]|nr:MAG: ribitol-5-phosphate dehydrogenase [Clostridiales bacterium]